ncbi:kinase-like domain-containing protein [Aspergillus granulosus]|uniref:EKC/KEOPS complex subunit BUD32 n=1 Tax=Aspergillus granulosus TaxID=176169 RepID=A0ABR4HYS2_9EURO
MFDIRRLRLWIRSLIYEAVSFVSQIGYLLPYSRRLDAPEPGGDIERRLGDKDISQRARVHHLDEPLVSNDPPPTWEILSNGSTAFVTRIKDGLVLKSPRYSWWHLSAESRHDIVKSIRKSFEVEEQIFHILGSHPRVVKFLGVSHDPQGLLLAEANGGNLQTFLDQHVGMTSLRLRLRWCSQAAEAVCFLHHKGVIHSDLRVENYLLHDHDLLLCDFGGSTSGNIDGGHLPDSGFFNPSKPWVSTEATDIFSLGSIFYTIMTDHWPYRSPGPFTSVEEKLSYCDKVDELFSSNKFPSTDQVVGGPIIQGCWVERYKAVEEIINDQSSLFLNAA